MSLGDAIPTSLSNENFTARNDSPSSRGEREIEEPQTPLSFFNKNGASFPMKLAELMVLHRATKALATACNIGVFDYLDGHETPRTSSEIGEHCKASTHGMTRLLQACASLNLLKSVVVDGKEKYELTEDSRRHLTMRGPEALRGEIACIDMEYNLTGNLEHAVRDGTTQWPRTLGLPEGGNLFDVVYSNEMFTLQFLSGMHGVSNVASPILVRSIDLSAYTKACDLGGGTGAFAYHAVAQYSQMTMSILELPPVVKASPHFTPPNVPMCQRSRVQFIPGDFFKDDLPEAQLYVMGRILHNWGENLCDILLEKAYKALPPGGAVLIVEAVLNDDNSGPVRVHLESLVMLAATGEGRERSGKEYTDLLMKHGFIDVEVYRAGTLLDGVLARKPMN